MAGNFDITIEGQVEEIRKLKEELTELKTMLLQLLNKEGEINLIQTRLRELEASFAQILKQMEVGKLEAIKKEGEIYQEIDKVNEELEESQPSSTPFSCEGTISQLIAPLLVKITTSCQEIADVLAERDLGPKSRSK